MGAIGAPGSRLLLRALGYVRRLSGRSGMKKVCVSYRGRSASVWQRLLIVRFSWVSIRVMRGCWASSSIRPSTARRIKICNIIGQSAREHVAFVVGKTLDAASAIGPLTWRALNMVSVRQRSGWTADRNSSLKYSKPGLAKLRPFRHSSHPAGPDTMGSWSFSIIICATNSSKTTVSRT